MLSESGMLEEMKVIVQQRNVGREALIAQQYESKARRISDQREMRKELNGIERRKRGSLKQE